MHDVGRPSGWIDQIQSYHNGSRRWSQEGLNLVLISLTAGLTWESHLELSYDSKIAWSGYTFSHEKFDCRWQGVHWHRSNCTEWIVSSVLFPSLRMTREKRDLWWNHTVGRCNPPWIRYSILWIGSQTMNNAGSESPSGTSVQEDRGGYKGEYGQIGNC